MCLSLLVSACVLLRHLGQADSDQTDSLINATVEWFLFSLHFKLDSKSAKYSKQVMHRAIHSSSRAAPSTPQSFLRHRHTAGSITNDGTMLPSLAIPICTPVGLLFSRRSPQSTGKASSGGKRDDALPHSMSSQMWNKPMHNAGAFCRQSYNHRMLWIGRDLKDHLFPIPLSWAGTSSFRSGCSELSPAWP